MRYTCEVCGKWAKDKFIFGTLHYCFPWLDSFRIKNSIYEIKELNEKTGEAKHVKYTRITFVRQLPKGQNGVL